MTSLVKLEGEDGTHVQNAGKGTSMYCLKTKPFRTEGTTQRNLEKNNWKRDGKSGLNLKLLEMAHPDTSELRELVDWPRS